MKSKATRLIIAGAALYGLFAVGVLTFYPDTPDNMDWEDREAFNKSHIAQLQIGAKREEVLALLGSPDISEAKKVGDKSIQVMFYRTQHKKSDGVTTQDECTPLLFKDNQLVAWGEKVYQDYLDG